MRKKTYIAVTLIFWVVILLFLALIFHSDNKYNTKMPLPQGGILSLTHEMLKEPIFLIDEWQISAGINPPGTVVDSTRTWIGEFSNYQRRHDPSLSPHGSATYQFRLRYDGDDTVIGLFFPNLCHEYRLWWDDALLADGFARAKSDLLLTAGEHTITVTITAHSGYYAGMYFPGAIGTASAIDRMIALQTSVYGVSFAIPLALALFCFSLWARTANLLHRNLALLCLSFSLSLSHYFLQFWNSPYSSLRFLISDLATFALFYFAMTVMLEASGLTNKKKNRVLLTAALLFAAASSVLYLTASLWPRSITIHGAMQDGCRLILFTGLILVCVHPKSKIRSESRLTLLCGSALGISLLVNLLSANLFEPIHGLWQYEWCSLLLVALFAALMEEQNHKLLLENRRYQEHLEDLVEERTQQLNNLLEERRAFFSDMAHDLKAPLSSLKASIHMIRSHNIALDNEFTFYLDLVEQQQMEMSRRVGSLSQLNTADRLTDAPEKISVNQLLDELYRIHNPEAVVMGIHLLIQPLESDAAIRVQKKKLLLAFENLFYNALRATPKNGSITFCSDEDESHIFIHVIDTGCGISPEDLPHIFQRFYIGSSGKTDNGTGLGLYIVKTILHEMGASISSESTVGQGSRFTLTFPKSHLPG